MDRREDRMIEIRRPSSVPFRRFLFRRISPGTLGIMAREGQCR